VGENVIKIGRYDQGYSYDKYEITKHKAENNKRWWL